MPDLSEPNTILYSDKEGNARVIGYVWNLVEEYARKHNAGVQLIDQVLEGKRLTRIQLLDMARNNVIDIGAAMQPLTLSHSEEYREYTYPVQVASWCTMLPLEPILEVREMYAWMMPGVTFGFLSLLWLIYELRNGRWHRHRRLLAIGWKVLALMLACNVQGRLITLFIAPPAKPTISNFDALSNSRLRIFSLRFEHSLYDFDLRTRYAPAFYLSDKISELLQLRNSMNTTYAYTVTHTKWQLYAEQQTSRLRPLFYYSENFCLYRFMSFALVMPESSPHRNNFHHYTLQLGQSGILQHWVRRSFYYMVQAGKLHRQDLSEPRHFNPLAPQDLHIILRAYALGVLISLTLFIVELLVSRFKIWMAS
ncbi:GH13931 [Drosophila grimshawi]|uniref:GH13931 n=2 Tax=Drosophila grimshawi TaxID=7222 RepID=B4JTM9_DROGR|nr:GH13931 [Drosophila grimshawi]